MIIYPQGRLGNQLFGLAYLLHHNQTNDKRALILLRDSELSRSVKLSISKKLQLKGVKVSSSSTLAFFLDLVFVLLEKLRKTDEAGRVEKFLNQYFYTLNKPWDSLPVERNYNKKLLVVRGFFQNIEMISQLSRESREMILSVIRTELDKKFWVQENSIGIHIRWGDYEEIEEYGTLRIEYFISALRGVNTAGSFVLAASDSGKALADLGEKIDLIELNSSKLSPLTTMSILSRCETFIMSNSTYSFWIAWCVAESKGTVIAPNPWFKSAKVPDSYLYLDTFKKINARFN